MTIDDDHLYHGSALIQIAEDRHFTAINSMNLDGRTCRSTYRINDGIGVYLKYAGRPTFAHSEYVFTFHRQHLDELRRVATATTVIFLALVCVKVREICCLPYLDLLRLIEARRKAKRCEESQYAILVSVRRRQKFRVYINSPGRKNAMLGDPFLITRSDFPKRIFL